jgi:hypothetical protein
MTRLTVRSESPLMRLNSVSTGSFSPFAHASSFAATHWWNWCEDLIVYASISCSLLPAGLPTWGGMRPLRSVYEVIRGCLRIRS